MILVTGGTGLIGSHLLFDLVQGNTPVRAIYRDKSKIAQVEKVFSYYHSNPKPLLDKIEWLAADILNIGSLEDAFEGVSHVYHCAALVSFAPKNYNALFEVNYQGTQNIVNLCLQFNIEKLLYVSSVAAIGTDDKIPVTTEENTWKNNPDNSNYSISKYAAELEVWRGTEEGLNAAMVNPTIVLGPGFWTEGSSAIFGAVAKGLPFYSLGSNSFVDVRDVSKTMLALMESDISAQRYILASETISYKSLFEKIALGLKVKPPKKAAAKWMGELLWRVERLRTALFGGKPFITKETARSAQRNSTFSSAKIRNEMGLTFRTLEETISDFSALYLKEH
ncbi:MAG: dihydroflavonol-4-reductase [Flavobacteriales bacterium]|jgi:dihydroflavonol-4-reductase